MQSMIAAMEGVTLENPQEMGDNPQSESVTPAATVVTKTEPTDEAVATTVITPEPVVDHASLLSDTASTAGSETVSYERPTVSIYPNIMAPTMWVPTPCASSSSSAVVPQVTTTTPPTTTTTTTPATDSTPPAT